MIGICPPHNRANGISQEVAYFVERLNRERPTKGAFDLA